MLLRASPFRLDVRGCNHFQNKVHSLGVFFWGDFVGLCWIMLDYVYSVSQNEKDHWGWHAQGSDCRILQRRFRRIVNLFVKIETDLDLNILRVSTRTRY